MNDLCDLCGERERWEGSRLCRACYYALTGMGSVALFLSIAAGSLALLVSGLVGVIIWVGAMHLWKGSLQGYEFERMPHGWRARHLESGRVGVGETKREAAHDAKNR